jgi:hypothetical protein
MLYAAPVVLTIKAAAPTTTVKAKEQLHAQPSIG